MAPLAGLTIIVSMVLLTVLVGTGRITVNKSSTAAPTSGCSAMPKQPGPIPRDPIAARGVAQVIGFGRSISPPERVTLSEGAYARLKIRFDSWVSGYNQFKCADLVDVYVKLNVDGVLPSDYTKPETQRLMIFLAAALDGSSSLPVFAFTPVTVSDQARPVAIEPQGGEPSMPTNTELPSYRVSLAVGRFITSIPSPEIAATVSIVNTTAKNFGGDELGKLGATKWTVSLTASGGSWTAAKDLSAGSITSLAPGAQYSTTELLSLKGPVDRKLEPGPAILGGQLTTKGKPIDAAASQVVITAL